MTIRDTLILFFIRKWTCALDMRRYGDPSEARAELHFSGVDLETIDPGHPLSGLRVARLLSASGLIDFRCVERNSSTYVLTAVDLTGIIADIRRRKKKFTSEELAQARRTVQVAIQISGSQI